MHNLFTFLNDAGNSNEWQGHDGYQPFLVYKDKITQPSSALCHSTELTDIICTHYGTPDKSSKPIMIIVSDGGGGNMDGQKHQYSPSTNPGHSPWQLVQSARRPPCPHGSESRTWKLHLHYRDFVQVNSKMADSTADPSSIQYKLWSSSVTVSLQIGTRRGMKLKYLLYTAHCSTMW